MFGVSGRQDLGLCIYQISSQALAFKGSRLLRLMLLERAFLEGVHGPRASPSQVGWNQKVAPAQNGLAGFGLPPPRKRAEAALVRAFIHRRQAKRSTPYSPELVRDSRPTSHQPHAVDSDAVFHRQTMPAIKMKDESACFHPSCSSSVEVLTRLVLDGKRKATDDPASPAAAKRVKKGTPEPEKKAVMKPIPFPVGVRTLRSLPSPR